MRISNLLIATASLSLLASAASAQQSVVMRRPLPSGSTGTSGTGSTTPMPTPTPTPTSTDGGSGSGGGGSHISSFAGLCGTDGNPDMCYKVGIDTDAQGNPVGYLQIDGANDSDCASPIASKGSALDDQVIDNGFLTLHDKGLTATCNGEAFTDYAATGVCNDQGSAPEVHCFFVEKDSGDGDNLVEADCAKASPHAAADSPYTKLSDVNAALGSCPNAGDRIDAYKRITRAAPPIYSRAAPGGESSTYNDGSVVAVVYQGCLGADVHGADTPVTLACPSSGGSYSPGHVFRVDHDFEIGYACTDHNGNQVGIDQTATPACYDAFQNDLAALQAGDTQDSFSPFTPYGDALDARDGSGVFGSSWIYQYAAQPAPQQPTVSGTAQFTRPQTEVVDTGYSFHITEHYYVVSETMDGDQVAAAQRNAEASYYGSPN